MADVRAPIAAGVAKPIRVEAEVIQNQPASQSASQLESRGGSSDGSQWQLVLRVPGWPGFQPGQFVMLSAGARVGVTRSDPLLPRPMAVYRTETTAGAEGGADVSILYKIVGRGTALLAEALPGQRIAIVGPLGRPFPAPESGERVLVVAGGTGTASVYELAAQLAESHWVEVFLGARTATELMAIADFEKLGVALRISTEDGSQGHRGLVTELLEAALDEADAPASGRPRVYTCGPTPMMRRCAEVAAARGVPCIAALENAMACGFGVCLGCAVPLKQDLQESDPGPKFALVCRDGPALDAATIDWERLP